MKGVSEKAPVNIYSDDDKNSKLKNYHKFHLRESYFDLLNDKTRINQSEFKGFVNLTIMICIFYVFTLPIHNYLKHGYFLKTLMIERMVHDLSILVIIWPLFHCWTYLAYILELLYLRGVPQWMCFIFQNLTQTGIFIFTSYVCLFSNMCTSHVLFTLTQCIVHFFKMHSYSMTNRDYREDYLKKINTGEPRISSYPENINFTNFMYFLRAPTFIYEENYPRTPSFRISYFILKLLKALFSITLMYYIYTEHIEITIPHILTTPIIHLVIQLYMPTCIFCFTAFYLIFECVLPGYAELATFGDRQFYDDWWNSTDLEEFNRRWNKVVHLFLYKHVYLEIHLRYKFSANVSKIATFLFSAILHEFCLCVMIRLFRPYMFGLMMTQIPLLYLGKKFLKNTTFGNLFFWFSLLIGNCLIFILYNKSYLLTYGHVY
jgi:hypothetical protein